MILNKKLCWLVIMLVLLLIPLSACTKSRPPASAEPEEEAESRTEFTRRIENFFEYQPLKAGQPSQFLIHLTDLTDGAPVEKAEVILTVKPKGGSNEIAQTKARIGKVIGIYVADLTIPTAGDYDIEFQVKNNKLDERLPLTDFKVE